MLLNHWRSLGLTPELTKDAIGDALKRLPVPREDPEFLRPTQIKRLLEAAARHDSAAFAETREEHAGQRPRGTTPRHPPIAPLVVFLLLSGCRRGEALGLRWIDIDLEATDQDARVVGEIRLRAEATKTHRARTIGLEVSPVLRRLLATMKLRAHKTDVFVFGGEHPFTEDMIDSARARLQNEFGAPSFTWKLLRSTCSTYLTNAPGIWGNAAHFLSAKQLGHSVDVAERHYAGVLRSVPRNARTLEAAMAIEHALDPVVRIVRATEKSAGGRLHGLGSGM